VRRSCTGGNILARIQPQTEAVQDQGDNGWLSMLPLRWRLVEVECCIYCRALAHRGLGLYRHKKYVGRNVYGSTNHCTPHTKS